MNCIVEGMEMGKHRSGSCMVIVYCVEDWVAGKNGQVVCVEHHIKDAVY